MCLQEGVHKSRFLEFNGSWNFLELGQGHGNIDKNMETWTRTWKHGQIHGNMDEDMETWTNTWKHGRGHRNIGEDIEAWTMRWNPALLKWHIQFYNP